MNRSRAILRMLGLAIAIYAGQMLCWPLVRAPCAEVVRAGAQAVFGGAVGASGHVRFERAPDPAALNDLVMVVRNRATGERGRVPGSSLFLAWRPLVFAVALILATPAPWRRRAASLAGGVALMLVVIAGRIWLRVYGVFAIDSPGLAVIEISPFGRAALSFAQRAVVPLTNALLLEPILVWAIVCGRSLAGMLRDPSPAAAVPAPQRTPRRGGITTSSSLKSEPTR